MARKKNDKNPDRKIEPAFRKTAAFLKSERTHFIVGLCFVMFAVYLFLSFLSFFFTGDADQSKLENLPISELSGVKNEIRNWTGAFGAYLSNLLINRWVGISSFLLCVLSGLTGLRLMKVTGRPLLRSFFLVSVLMIWGSLFFGFFFITGYEDTFIYLGGVHGYYLTLLLEANIGWLGTFLLILSSLIIIMILASRKTIPFLRKVLSWRYRRNSNPEKTPETETAAETADADSGEAPDTDSDTSLPLCTTAGETEEEQTLPVLPAKEKTAETAEDEKFEILPAPAEEMVKETVVAENPSEPIFTIAENPGDDEPYEGDDVGEYDPTLDLSHYKYPTFDLLNAYDTGDKQIDMEEQKANKQRITDTLEHYGIRISSIKATVGPTITLYEIVPEPGVRISKIRNLEDDIALSLAALGIRIIAPIPGKGTIGIEVPNKDPQIVSMQSVIASKKFQECKYDLPIAFGKTITNEIFMADLCKMPHVLVAGATGQGKSVGLNAIITSLLYKKHPSQLKFVLVDPKKVEFNIYATIEKHFLAKLPDAEEAIITDVTKVVQTLNSITKEMDDRYDLLKKAHARNIKEYNAKFIGRRLNPNNGHRYMPYIVVIVDEFGDLIMTAGKEVELPIARIAQLARAVGIHMVIATQRPSTNIITGVIKANFPARVAFRVSSMIDSRTILDCPGANQLIGRGDLLFSQGSDLIRVQCAFVDTPEVEDICSFIGEQQGYPTAYLLPEYVGEGSEAGIGEVDLKDRDPMFEEAARLIVANQQGSTSLIQRKFSIGYNRAGRIMDQLEAAGIVGPFEGSKARQVMVMDEYHLDEILNSFK